MAGEQLKYRHRLGASSLVEVLIAMVIILIVFVIAMRIVTNVTFSSVSSQKIQAALILKHMMITAEQDKNNTSQQSTVGDFQITEEVKGYRDNFALSQIHLTATDVNGKTVAELEQVIINK